jgi:hypothetical protein
MLMKASDHETRSHEIVKVLAPHVDLGIKSLKVDPYRMLRHLRRLPLGIFPGCMLRLETTTEICSHDLPMDFSGTNVVTNGVSLLQTI